MPIWKKERSHKKGEECGSPVEDGVKCRAISFESPATMLADLSVRFCAPGVNERKSNRCWSFGLDMSDLERKFSYWCRWIVDNALEISSLQASGSRLMADMVDRTGLDMKIDRQRAFESISDGDVYHILFVLCGVILYFSKMEIRVPTVGYSSSSSVYKGVAHTRNIRQNERLDSMDDDALQDPGMPGSLLKMAPRNQHINSESIHAYCLSSQTPPGWWMWIPLELRDIPLTYTCTVFRGGTSLFFESSYGPIGALERDQISREQMVQR
ncbi:hypothetical protein FA15DRAFT_653432 [Coprinopsis marcescibilis]|uniref:Uncharacterized protein n=1 Tax=Coprinopsis marcescibilis TaxID=230819 RepID=A0A5C3L4M7_COPMA|nr:hypothetical protein FA15DRAFT_653432 [Coprinopsis marcescibilis]